MNAAKSLIVLLVIVEMGNPQPCHPCATPNAFATFQGFLELASNLNLTDCPGEMRTCDPNSVCITLTWKADDKALFKTCRHGCPKAADISGVHPGFKCKHGDGKAVGKSTTLNGLLMRLILSIAVSIVSGSTMF